MLVIVYWGVECNFDLFRNDDIIERLIQTLEQYVHHLETLVKARTKKLEKEKKRIKNLVNNLLPG